MQAKLRENPFAALAAFFVLAYVGYILMGWYWGTHKVREIDRENGLQIVASRMVSFEMQYGSFPNPDAKPEKFPEECKTDTFRGLASCLDKYSSSTLGKTPQEMLDRAKYCASADGRTFKLVWQDEKTDEKTEVSGPSNRVAKVGECK